MIVSAGATHTGMKREHNEDCFHTDSDLGLYLVADGVGGHANGEVASAIVKQTISSEVVKGSSLNDAVLMAHKAVLAEIDSRQGSNMGSTVVAVVMNDNDYEIVWVGDSRAYLYDGKISRLTQDHNPVSQMLAEGILSEEEAQAHPDKNVLSQSIGVSRSVRVDPGRVTGTLASGEQIILCSDGLTDELNDPAIANELAGHAEPEDQVNVLINAALKSGGRDNVTIVIIGQSKFGLDIRSTERDDPTQCLAKSHRDNHHGEKHDLKVLGIVGAMALVALLWVFLSG